MCGGILLSNLHLIHFGVSLELIDLIRVLQCVTVRAVTHSLLALCFAVQNRKSTSPRLAFVEQIFLSLPKKTPPSTLTLPGMLALSTFKCLVINLFVANKKCWNIIVWLHYHILQLTELTWMTIADFYRVVVQRLAHFTARVSGFADFSFGSLRVSHVFLASLNWLLL